MELILESKPVLEWDSPLWMVLERRAFRADLRRFHGREMLYPRIEEMDDIIAARLLGRFWNGKDNGRKDDDSSL